MNGHFTLSMSNEVKFDFPTLLQNMAEESMLIMLGDSPSYRVAFNTLDLELQLAYLKYSNYYEDSNWTRFERIGLKKTDLTQFLDLTQKIRKMFIMPLNTKKDEPINRIFAIYYFSILEDITKILEEIDEVIEKCPKFHLEEKFWVESTQMYEDQERKIGKLGIVRIYNPYKLYQDNANIVKGFMDYVKEKSEDPDLKKLVFSGVFAKVKDITNQLIENNISKEEMRMFLMDYNTIILKGFGMLDIMFKLSQSFILDEYAHVRLPFCDKKFNEEQIIMLEQMKYMHICYKIILGIPVCTNNIMELMEKHRKDEIGRMLKPLIEEIIPYIQSMTPVKLWTKWIKYFEPIYEAYRYKNRYFIKKRNCSKLILIDSPLFFPYMIDMLPIVVDEAPSNKYLQNFISCFKKLTSYYFTMLIGNYDYVKIDFDELDEIDEITSLNQQKLYIAWYMMKIPMEREEYRIRYALVCSIIPWRIDDSSEEARDIEQRITTFIRKACQYCDSYDYYIRLFDIFSKSIWNATQPLDMELIKMKIDRNYEEGCCIIQ